MNISWILKLNIECIYLFIVFVKKCVRAQPLCTWSLFWWVNGINRKAYLIQHNVFDGPIRVKKEAKAGCALGWLYLLACIWVCSVCGFVRPCLLISSFKTPRWIWQNAQLYLHLGYCIYLQTQSALQEISTAILASVCQPGPWRLSPFCRHWT